ncbi:Breakpoint cluster region protein [Liparis tanakae]|uniref:Breakpoint cluster region protein n=1 Tax=Liparis tanakae TaxID=230148 RepID=A0A4Z2IIA6_9TELE|nr:Breakpoint cluster region protein [Liparis tanakae]
MGEPVGFVAAWRAQFPESDPPCMELNSLGNIEQELDKCKTSIRHLEEEVNKERFRMIYLQTLLAKERKSYDGQRWGFKGTPHVNEGELPGERPHAEEAPAEEQQQQRGSGKTGRCKPHPEGEVDGASPAKQKGGVSPVHLDSEAPDFPLGTGSVAALRSNFERIRRANSHTAGDGRGLSVMGGPERPFYVNMEYHSERGLVKVNDREVSDKISTLGSQAMQMERKRSLHSLPGNLSAAAGDISKAFQRGRSSEGNCSHNGSYDDPEVSPHFLKDGAKKSERHSAECQPYTSVYVGGMMAEGDTRVIHIRDHSVEEDAHLTWPRRSYSPGSFDDVGGGYTPDCSSNENLTSSEEDFSSGPSSHVSPSPTTYQMYREKSRSPSQHSLDSSSPPTPLSQKRLKQQGMVSEASVIGVRKPGQVWPSDGESTTSSRTSHDNSVQGDLEIDTTRCLSRSHTDAGLDSRSETSAGGPHGLHQRCGLKGLPTQQTLQTAQDVTMMVCRLTFVSLAKAHGRWCVHHSSWPRGHRDARPIIHVKEMNRRILPADLPGHFLGRGPCDGSTVGAH